VSFGGRKRSGEPSSGRLVRRTVVFGVRGRVSSQADGARFSEAEDALDAAEFAFGA
jgi:hypothetical protein